MPWLLNALGALLILVALRDIFHTLWHPRGFGSLGRLVFSLVWRATRLRDTELGGPLGMLIVVSSWATLIVIGWTLVYLPHMPERFNFASPLAPGRSSDLVDSVYLSLVAVGTLGFGDITPEHPALRVLVPLQALVGFVLFTAAISWVLQVYPALSRRRSLAERLSILASTDTAGYVENGEPAVVTRLLQSVAEDLIAVRADLTQYGESYYFREVNSSLSLAANLPYTLDLVAAARRSPSPDTRQLAAVLDGAVAATAAALEDVLGRFGSTREVLDAFASDHRHAGQTATPPI